MQAPTAIDYPARSFTIPEQAATLCGMTVHRHPLHRTRWLNFRALIGPERGAIVSAATLLGKTPGQVSHFGGERPIKNIGDDVAAEIERAWGKPPRWLDEPHEPFGLGDEPVKNGDGKPRSASQNEGLDAVMLARAESWVRFEEKAGAKFQSVRRAERLIELYSAIAANGGNLTPEQAEVVIDGARSRIQQGATKRGRPKAGSGGSA